MSNIYRPQEVTYENGIETNLYGIAEQICSKGPQTPCSIQLIMDHDLPKDDNGQDVDFQIFELDLLKDFTISCIQILFGKKINPMELTEQNLDLLNAYIHSISYHMITNVEETETSYQFKISFVTYDEYFKGSHTNPLEHLSQYMASDV